MTSKMTSEKCNEPRSEELCGSGRKFQLSWKAKYNRIDGQTPCLLFSLYKCSFQLHHERRVHMQHLFKDSNHTCAQQ